jgi:hypothetical protein
VFERWRREAENVDADAPEPKKGPVCVGARQGASTDLLMFDRKVAKEAVLVKPVDWRWRWPVWVGKAYLMSHWTKGGTW